MHLVLELASEALELALEPLVLEGRHAAALLADGMVMVLSARDHRLVAGRPLAELDPLNQAQLVEKVDGAVDAGDADVAARPVKLLRDLIRREAAALAAQQGDDRLTGATGPVSSVAERRSRRLFPIRCVPVSHAGQASS